MNSTTLELFRRMEKSFYLQYHAGNRTLVTSPNSTGWRVLPVLVVSQIDYNATGEFADRKIRIAPGETVSIAPGVSHNLTAAKGETGYSRWCHLQCDVFPGVSLFHLVEPPLVVRGSGSRKIGRINQEMGTLSPGKHSLAALVRRQALAWELISMLIQSAPFRADRIALLQNASRLTPVLAFIEENLAAPITHELLARKANLSPSRFHFLFKSALGSAPYEYVQQVRLKKAQELLIRTDRSIAEIGLEVGHPDPFHFSRMFRRLSGISPLKYRKQLSLGSF